MDENYIPFGDDWAKEVIKMRKKDIVVLYRESAMRVLELQNTRIVKSTLQKALENEGKGLKYLSREELIKVVVAVRKSYDELYNILGKRAEDALCDALENKAIDDIAFKKED